MNKQYLGDGVYAEFNESGQPDKSADIILTTKKVVDGEVDGEVVVANKIYLEQATLRALFDFAYSAENKAIQQPQILNK